ncbi:hypothetical protein [Pseudodesulfovibrio mercurii]|uniref:hypothetical protein n=1 Tax=Pseudodesulfovibrio mercurii TaxID=641491 RepID=UPI001EE6799E|nr:hypothetical protein [Pseudodesulfovibrio mercurii]
MRLKSSRSKMARERGGAGALGALDLDVQDAVEGAPIGQPGQRVVVGLVGKPLQGLLEPLQLRVGVAVDGQGEPLPEIAPGGDGLPLLAGDPLDEPEDPDRVFEIPAGLLGKLAQLLLERGQFRGQLVLGEFNAFVRGHG